MGKRGPQEVRDLLWFWARVWYQQFKGMRDGIRGRVVDRGPSPIVCVTTDREARELWEKLRRARTATRVQEICKQSSLWNRKTYVKQIYDQAAQFIAAREGYPERTVPVPAERELWEGLLRAETVRQVRAIYRRSKYWLNPRWRGKVYVRTLYEHADQFLDAKKARRYPDSARPSSDDRRLRFLAAAMAGITVGRRPRTANDSCGKPSPKLGKRFWEPILRTD